MENISKRQKKVTKLHWFLLFILFVVAVLTVSAQGSDRLLHIYFLDVGQGDSVFIKTPAGHKILIDGGPDARVINQLSKAMPFYIRTIDLVILTHPDKDHISGLIDVLKRYKVKAILEPGIKCVTVECAAWDKFKKEEGAKIFNARLGQKLILGKNTSMTILNPFDNLENENISNDNNASVVAKLNYGNSSFLFTGDIEKSAEKRLLYANLDLDIDVLKISHHGSKISSSDELLQAAMPDIAVIQVGRNRYGHPTQEVLLRLENLGIKYYRTDRDGTVELVTDGFSYLVKYL